jgi:2-keto-4-pentenoate hydratase/2-oxohepta-3-ene-1,7-dioic acid hydratase in catechol pathway
MRFVTYQRAGDGVDRVGVVDGSTIHGIPGVGRLLDLLGDDGTTLRAAGAAALDAPAESIALGEATLRPPIPVPPSMRDFMTFEQHIAGTQLTRGPDAVVPKVFYRQPVFYFSNPTAMRGPFEDVPIAPGSKSFDFEAEFAAVVGRPGKNLTVEEATASIAGYMILNDWSARDVQAREMGGNLGPAKGKDTATTIGPWLVTPDELAPYASEPSFALTMEVELNGERFGADRLDHMAWSFGQLISFASRGALVQAGDIIGSGTCGDGCIAEKWGRQGFESQRALQPGDVVTIRVEHVGEISNTIVAADELIDIGPGRAAPPA